MIRLKSSHSGRIRLPVSGGNARVKQTAVKLLANRDRVTRKKKEKK